MPAAASYRRDLYKLIAGWKTEPDFVAMQAAADLIEEHGGPQDLADRWRRRGLYVPPLLEAMVCLAKRREPPRGHFYAPVGYTDVGPWSVRFGRSPRTVYVSRLLYQGQGAGGSRQDELCGHAVFWLKAKRPGAHLFNCAVMLADNLHGAPDHPQGGKGDRDG